MHDQQQHIRIAPCCYTKFTLDDTKQCQCTAQNSAWYLPLLVLFAAAADAAATHASAELCQQQLAPVALHRLA
jgi:hypothetical protein